MSRVDWAMDARNTGELPMMSRLVLGAIAWHVDHRGISWPLPDSRQLATDTGLTVRQVATRRRYLRDRGYLAAMLYPAA